MFHSFLFIFTGGFLAVKELPVIAAKVNHNLLQYDIRILRGKLQGMQAFGHGELDGALHHPAGYCGIIDTVDVLRLFVQVGIEIHNLGSPTIHTDFIFQTTLVKIIKR